MRINSSRGHRVICVLQTFAYLIRMRGRDRDKQAIMPGSVRSGGGSLDQLSALCG